MTSATERRALYYENDDSHDPMISVDINEYLIEEWPKLTLAQRKAVWTLCQNDEEFDFDPIYEQIDTMVVQLAETDKTIDLSDVEIIDDDEEDEYEDEYEDDEYEDDAEEVSVS